MERRRLLANNIEDMKKHIYIGTNSISRTFYINIRNSATDKTVNQTYDFTNFTGFSDLNDFIDKYDKVGSGTAYGRSASNISSYTYSVSVGSSATHTNFEGAYFYPKIQAYSGTSSTSCQNTIITLNNVIIEKNIYARAANECVDYIYCSNGDVYMMHGGYMQNNNGASCWFRADTNMLVACAYWNSSNSSREFPSIIKIK